MKNYIFLYYISASLLNRVGCVLTWVTSVGGLRGSVGLWVAWVKFLRGLRGLRRSKYFLRGPKSFCVGLCVGQVFLRGSNIFALVNFYLLDETILRD